MLSFDHPLRELPGVGPVMARRLERLNLTSVLDLLRYFPSRYEDFSILKPIASLKVGERVTVRGRVQLVSSRRTFRRRLMVTEALIADDSGTIKAVWFNQPYLAHSLRTGATVLLAGTLSSSSYGSELVHPSWEPEARGGLHTSRLVPLYPRTGDLTNYQLRALVARVLPLARTIADWLPHDLRQSAKLLPLGRAVAVLHFPQSRAELQLARRRVTFDELCLMHLTSRLARRGAREARAPAIPFSPQTKEFVAKLPWPLTTDQRVAAWEIIQNLAGPLPMLRLLQGDVGSGKTIVAGLAAFNAARAGWQTAFLAPTEILARQHFATLVELFGRWQVRLGLMARGQHEVAGVGRTTHHQLRAQLARGELDIVIGTHTLLQRSVAFKQLGLVVVDEQHRFGVGQRQALAAGTGSARPHLLSLSATPIPRSLALTLFGDLDVSVLRSLPPGRQPIATRIVPPAERDRAYQLIRREVAAGRRAFIVCPLIDEGSADEARAATAEHERLQREVFPAVALGLLHGRLNPRAKAAAMRAFHDGTTPILVCTSVVEVGVDVPQATAIAIESAERFGLAQLHQLRGRVGRSSLPSTCLLLTDTNDAARNPRLVALTRFQSGFELAEFDLQSRGPGDLLGQAQSGFLRLRFAELADAQLMALVRRTADYLLKHDPNLTALPLLKEHLKTLAIHPE